MKISILLPNYDRKYLRFLIFLLVLLNFSSRASSVDGCDDYVCQDYTFFGPIPYVFEMEFVVGDVCNDLSFSPDSLNQSILITEEGITPYTIYNLLTGDSCTANVNILCSVNCPETLTIGIPQGKDSVEFLPSDFLGFSCYSDEEYLPPHASGIFYEGVYDVVVYSPILDDSCTTELTVVYAGCASVGCDLVNYKYYNDTLWPQDIWEFECPDTAAFLIEILDDQGGVLASGNSIFLDESLPDTTDVRILNIETGLDCIGELRLFHNCLIDAIDTLCLDFTGVENIILPWDSLFTSPCEHDFGPGFTIAYVPGGHGPSHHETIIYSGHDGGMIEFTNFSQDGVLTILDSRTGKFERKDIVFENKSLNLLFGFIFQDDEGDCWIDSLPASGPEGFLVYAAGETDTIYAYTLFNGLYNLFVPSLHTYEIGVVEFNNYWDVCISESPIYKEPFAQAVHIGLAVDTICSYLTSDLSIPRFRRCFDNNIYFNYCNLGSDTAYDVILDFYFDEGLDIDAAAYGFTIVDDTHYQLEIGNLDPLECGALEIVAFVDCDLDFDTELCVEIELSPIPDCNDSEEWTGAALDVQGICDGDSVRFTITNIGDADMALPQEFIVIEDDIMIIQDMVELPEGESVEIVLPANGSTYNLIANQEPFHPYTEQISALVKACSDGNSGISTGFANSFVLDERAPFISIECLPVIGSYDPNDKAVTPEGAYDNHIITGDEELEYTIRFENTGSDTAFNIKVLDTLDGNLDLFSFRLMGSSHPVEVDFPINGILNFRFDNIELPDTSVNNLGAQGFVKFAIRPKQGLPIGTKIYNSAGIYFDFNHPIITNVVDLQIGEYMTTGVDNEIVLKSNIVSPNPAFQVLNVLSEFEHFIIADISGSNLLEGKYSSKIDIESLDSGIYIIQIYDNDSLIGVQRFVKVNPK